MLDELQARIFQKYRTGKFPSQEPILPEKYIGKPVIDASDCPEGCSRCIENCPTRAIELRENKLQLDMGRCIFCRKCELSCQQGQIHFTKEYRLAHSVREKLILTGNSNDRSFVVNQAIRKTFGRSLKLRQVSAGGCNACEADTNVLNTLVFDLARFGIQFVASPRHADGLLVTGPVTKNMETALLKTYEAIPFPKIVIVVGACAISGGLFSDNSTKLQGAASLFPVDLYVPGCPPNPYTILDGLLELIGRRS